MLKEVRMSNVIVGRPALSVYCGDVKEGKSTPTADANVKKAPGFPRGSGAQRRRSQQHMSMGPHLTDLLLLSPLRSCRPNTRGLLVESYFAPVDWHVPRARSAGIAYAPA